MYNSIHPRNDQSDGVYYKQGSVAQRFKRLEVQGFCRWDIAALIMIVALALVLRLVSLATIPPAEAAAGRPGFNVVDWLEMKENRTIPVDP